VKRPGILALAILLGTTGEILAGGISGQNELRYARRGTGDILKPAGNWGYFENDLEIDATHEAFRLHLRQRFLHPSEFGVEQSGFRAIDKKYLEYRGDYLTIRGGDFYRNWGRGLIMGMTEVREINYDTGLQGVLVEGAYEDFEGAIFRGGEIDTSGVAQESAEGLNLGYRLPFGLRLGTSILHFDEGPRHTAFDRRGYEVNYPFDFGQAYVVYVADSFDPVGGRFSHGFYSALELYGTGWGAVIDYKNYRLPPYFTPALQYPPPVQPEVTFNVFDRYPHTPYYDNEVGLQTDINLALPFDWSVKINYDQVSRQNVLTMLPSYRDYLGPYWSLWSKAERSLPGGDRYAVLAGYKEQTSFWHRYGGGAHYEHRWMHDIAFTTEFQHLWNVMLHEVFQGQDPSGNWLYGDRQFRDALVSFSVSKPRLGTITFLCERSGDIYDISGVRLNSEANRKFWGADGYWPSAELAITAVENHQLRLFYGYERGGIRCSGGLCRNVNPLKGVKVTLTSQF